VIFPHTRADIGLVECRHPNLKFRAFFPEILRAHNFKAGTGKYPFWRSITASGMMQRARAYSGNLLPSLSRQLLIDQTLAYGAV
jgi:hypothetical protein